MSYNPNSKKHKVLFHAHGHRVLVLWLPVGRPGLSWRRSFFLLLNMLWCSSRFYTRTVTRRHCCSGMSASSWLEVLERWAATVKKPFWFSCSPSSLWLASNKLDFGRRKRTVQLPRLPQSRMSDYSCFYFLYPIIYRYCIWICSVSIMMMVYIGQRSDIACRWQPILEYYHEWKVIFCGGSSSALLVLHQRCFRKRSEGCQGTGSESKNQGPTVFFIKKKFIFSDPQFVVDLFIFVLLAAAEVYS